MKIKVHYLVYVYLPLWFVINLLFLTRYPSVHSDEPWLSGLSRSMISNNSVNSTEDFFDLYERHPHGIKTLFHLLQISFIKIFSYSIFTIRLLSLVTGIFCLLLLYKVILKVFKTDKKSLIALFVMVICSVDTLFLYLSHLGRQEIFLIFFTLLMLNILLNRSIKPKQRGLLTGLILGLSVGFHPNSFIIAWPIGLYFLIEIFRGRRQLSEGVIFIFSTLFMTSIFVALSFSFNPNFIQDYLTYGKPLGVLDTTDVKLLKLPNFYSKIFNQISGTYHNPNIKMQMLLFPIFLLFPILKRRNIISIIGFFGFNIGLFIIGKYSQPSIGLLTPFYYISVAIFIDILIESKKFKLLFMTPLLFLTLFFSIIEINREKESYHSYLNQITKIIPSDSNVLCGIINDYGFADGNIYDWRNLHYLKENNLTLRKYITDRDIEYIIIPDELYYIYKNRPYWNVLYGNTSDWFPRLNTFIENNCELINQFNSPGYGNRIVALRYLKQWNVKIYRVDQIVSVTPIVSELPILSIKE
ncbi:MAG: glycosyltransferase family 39 protein [Spirochaetaceae bacterium]